MSQQMSIRKLLKASHAMLLFNHRQLQFCYYLFMLYLSVLFLYIYKKTLQWQDSLSTQLISTILICIYVFMFIR